VTIPIWLAALVLAVAAPLIVRGIATFIEHRARARTVAALEKARREG
jgi:hypothetical protein